ATCASASAPTTRYANTKRNSMSRNETFIPRHMPLDLLAGEQVGVGAQPEITNAGEQIGIKRSAGANIDRGHDCLEALEGPRLVEREIGDGHHDNENGADHAEIGERSADPPHA